MKRVFVCSSSKIYNQQEEDLELLEQKQNKRKTQKMSMTIFTNKITNKTTKEAMSTLLHIYRPRRDPRESRHEGLCVQNVQNLF